ncbi:MAG: hypothetical protein ACKVQW_04665 [Pyrinomonadaceae bacterium]
MDTIIPLAPFDYFSLLSSGRQREDFAHEQPSLESSIPVQPLNLNDLVLSPETNFIIGSNARHRIDEFSRYPFGWYGGKGKKLSKWSVANFDTFVKCLPELKRVNPSVFLTLEGNLALGWEDRNGKKCEIEFFPDKVEYFIEVSNEELSVGLIKIFDLADRFRGLL